MALLSISSSSPPASYSRKRTSSFSVSTKSLAPSPRPLKAQRTMSSITCTTTMTLSAGGSLKRTTTYLTIPALPEPSYSAAAGSSSSSSKLQPATPLQAQLPYQRTLKYYKDQRERRKAQVQQRTPADQQHLTASTTPTPTPPPRVTTPAVAPPQQRQPSSNPKIPSYMKGKWKCTSPLSPSRPTYTPLHPQLPSTPPRTCYPRSKPEPDLYRKAITARMRSTPEGQKILLMGARLAVSIIEATRQLESLVAASQYGQGVPMDCDRDDPMNGSGNSWACAPGEDWEMVG